MPVITLASAKGGSGKTTAAVGLAAAAPGSVLLVDCDPSEGALRWYTALDLPEVPRVAVARSVGRLQAVLKGSEADFVIVDTPPLFEDQRLVREAVELADVAITPILPSPADVDRLPLLQGLATDVGTTWAVLVVQERSWTKAGGELRPALTEAGVTTLRTGIPAREATRTAWATRAPDPAGFGWLWEELTGN